jgi:beta-lactamase class C
MAAQWHGGVQPVVAELMQAHTIPGMVVAVARGNNPPEHLIAGTDGAGQSLAADSLFPVASITKLATALAIHRLADAGRLTVEDPLERHVPEAAAQPGITLRRLLTHTSGVRGHDLGGRAPRTADLSWATIAQATLQVVPEQPPGAQVSYSNHNYTLLAIVVERLTGQPFPAALQELVLRPLGIEGYLGAEPPRPVVYIAGVPADEFTGTPLERTNSAFERSLGSPAGGLVTTVDGALALVRAYHGLPADFLRPDTRAAATRDQAGGVPGDYGPTSAVRYERCPWGLGPELLGDKRPHWAPPEASPESFGHYGATGCVAWLDPRAGVSWAVHSARMPTGLESRVVMSTIGAVIMAAVGQRPAERRAGG